MAFAFEIWPPQMTSRDLVPMAGIKAALSPDAMPLGIDTRNSPQPYRFGQAADRDARAKETAPAPGRTEAVFTHTVTVPGGQPGMVLIVS